MTRYRKKPVEIDAIQFRRDCFEEVREFTGGHATNFRTERCINGKSYCEIETLEGTMKASDGDYIIKGVKGEFYPCKPDIFELTYEEVQEEKKYWDWMKILEQENNCKVVDDDGGRELQREGAIYMKMTKEEANKYFNMCTVRFVSSKKEENKQ